MAIGEVMLSLSSAWGSVPCWRFCIVLSKNCVGFFFLTVLVSEYRFGWKLEETVVCGE